MAQSPADRRYARRGALRDAVMAAVGCEPLERILPRLENVKKNGVGYTARCPGHDDRRNSLSIRAGDDRRVLLHCFTGCEPERIVAAVGLTMADLFVSNYGRRARRVRRRVKTQGQRGEGEPIPSDHTAPPQHAGLTVAEYAAAKKLDPDRLRAFGLADVSYMSRPAVRMAYRDEAGNEVAVRFRLRLDKGADGDDRFRWKSGAKPCLYGRDRLALAHERGYIVLVEGESDCHTLWSHGEPTLGVPGAANWNEARDAPALESIPIVYAVIEGDTGGSALLRALAASALCERVRLIELGELKDPSGLYLADSARFAERWEAAKAGAIPLSERIAAEAEEEAAAAWKACRDLAQAPNILARVADAVAALGVAGERVAVLLVFLAVVSRLQRRPVNVAVKGPSSGGKSYLVEQTLRLFPPEAYFALTAMSERALAYSDEPLAHRVLVLYEAAGQSGDMGSYLMRSLLSEGRIRYMTVEKTPAGLRPRLIEREGPTGLIVTTTKASLHPENETRMVSLTVSDTPEQTRAVYRALANGRPAEPDLAPWHALQRWLALGERRVAVPFAPALAELTSTTAVRMRRDFGLFLALVEAHALLHRTSRETAPDGAILATLDDYDTVRALAEPLMAAGVEASVPATIRETVAAVARLCPDAGATASVAAIARELRLDKSAASRRALAAKERGYLVNHETKKGQPAKYALGEPLPEDAPVLPDRCSVAAWWQGHGAPPPPADDDDPFADDPFTGTVTGEPGNDQWTA
jgi:hypothetical protein